MANHEDHECKTTLPLSDDNIAAATKRIALIRSDVQGAINCWNRMVSEHRLNDRDFRKAVRKYVEDVGESIKVLDCETGHGLLDALIEFEEWKGLKGIRNIIAHQHWKIDDGIVFDAVANTFPTLFGMFGRLLVYERALKEDETWELPVSKSQAVRRTSALPLHRFREYRYTIAAAYHCDEGWLVERVVIINHQGGLSHLDRYDDDGNPDGTRMRVRGRVPSRIFFALTPKEADELTRRNLERRS